MTVTPDRQLRADAARNADRILRAARDVYSTEGPDVSMDVVASRAGVGERTLYRRFPSKGDLTRAALDQSIAENLAPAIERARRCSDPLKGFTDLLDAAISLGAREHNLLAAARKAGALAGISAALDAAMSDLIDEAQQAGLVRADLVSDDLPRIVVMLNSVLWTMDPADGGWRRYVALVLDGMTTTNGRRLQRAPKISYPLPEADWPL